MGDPSSVAREAAAAAAAELVEPGMVVGLGSGRAVWKLIEALGPRLADGEDLAGLQAATASLRTEQIAAAAGIDVVQLDGRLELDLALDGADEVDPRLRLIKGGGGALLREKIVISAARRFVVVAEAAKRVERLGESFALPVEVVRFGWRDTQRRLASLLREPRRRTGPDGEPYVTDEGHFILDCPLHPEADIDALALNVGLLPGVVEHGLFIDMADSALFGRDDGGVDVLERG